MFNINFMLLFIYLTFYMSFYNVCLAIYVECVAMYYTSVQLCHIASYLSSYITSLSETIHIHLCDTHTPQTAVHDTLFVDCYILNMKLCYCVLVLEKLFSSFQLNVHHVAESCTVKPLFYGHLAAIQVS